MQTLTSATAAVTAVQNGSTKVHKVQTKHQKGGKITEEVNRSKTPSGKDQEGTRRQSCYCCGAKPAHSESECPAKDATCHRCGKSGHYQKCCKSKMSKSSKPNDSKHVRVPGLQTHPGASVSQPIAKIPPFDYFAVSELPGTQPYYSVMFHHMQTIHVKSIDDSSSKHIKPLYVVEYEEGRNRSSG